jgi:hypothetical protein
VGCCGKRRTISFPTKGSVVPNPVVIAEAVNTGELRTVVRGGNDFCVYCNTPISMKVKKDHRGSWRKVPWCSKCRLEV